MGEAHHLSFFMKSPDALPLYEAVRDMILLGFEDVTVRVLKTQIAFSNRYNFAFVSLPFRKVKGRPEVYIILTLGLGYRLEHPRVVECVEPYPGRWTHHVIIQSMDEVDAQVREWIGEAYDFSNAKGMRR